MRENRTSRLSERTEEGRKPDLLRLYIDTIGLHRTKRLSCVEAAELLGMSERHFRRLRDAYEERGAEGIVDRRRGRASGRRAGVDEIAWLVEAFRTRYFDFTAKHFHEAIHGRPMTDGKLFGRYRVSKVPPSFVRRLAYFGLERQWKAALEDAEE